MKRRLIIATRILTLSTAGIVATTAFSPLEAQSPTTQVATVQTATFAIANMTCALCPVTVKSAIERVTGVQTVQIDLAAKTATVVFDPSVTNIEAIAAASTNAGYPASVEG